MIGRGWLLAGVWTAVMGGLAALAGCYPHNCDGDFQHYGRNAGEGRMVDANTWESTAIDADWLPFPHQRFWDFDIDALGDRTPSLVLPYVSANRNPIAIGDNFTLGSGNLTEISAVNKNHVTIHNGTCADYYLRLVVIAPPLPPSTPAAPPPPPTPPPPSTDAGTGDGATP
jgi:hypothetical protein